MPIDFFSKLLGEKTFLSIVIPQKFPLNTSITVNPIPVTDSETELGVETIFKKGVNSF